MNLLPACRAKALGAAPARRRTLNYAERLRNRRCERRVRELEERLRNPWRESQGSEGALEAWG